jgi:spermidine synthase
MFSQWFAKFDASPTVFTAITLALALGYLVRIHRQEFVLFSTACVTMGSEILVIFAFEIFFGYIYFQIGLIVTVFLAGLLPGALIGRRLTRRGIKPLRITDGLLVLLLSVMLLAIKTAGAQLPELFFLGLGFVISMLCGCQFPIILHLIGNDNAAATRSFSADLIGAATGLLVTSVILLPYLGLAGAILGLIGLKMVSLAIVRFGYDPIDPPSFS